jgi:hypothetical protein
MTPSDQTADTLFPNHGSVRHIDISDDPRLLTSTKRSGDSTEKPDTLLLRTVDKQVPYLVPLPIESALKGYNKARIAIKSSNRVPALSSIGRRACQFLVAGRSGIEVVHESMVAGQVIPHFIQVIPGVYLQVPGRRGDRTARTACHRGK